MTQLFTEEGESVPVTVIEAAPNRVTAVRTDEADGYSAVQLGWDKVAERKLTKGRLGHLAKTDSPPLKHLVEFRDFEGEVELGGEVTVAEFDPVRGSRSRPSPSARASRARSSATTSAAAPSATAPTTSARRARSVPVPDPARVFKGRKMPGRMGGERVTQKGLEVFRVDADRHLLMLRGSIPGPKNGTVEVRTDG